MEKKKSQDYRKEHEEGFNNFLDDRATLDQN